MATMCYTKDGNKKSLLSLTERITTPSIHIQKDGNHWYVPLFSGDKGSVIQSGDYNYTLGEFKVGSYRAAISREVANHRPGIKILSRPSGITGGVISETDPLRFTVTDIDNDLLTVDIYCTRNNPAPGSPYNFQQTAIKTYKNVSSGSTISFSGYVPESGAHGYAGAGDYILSVKVTDSKGASVSSANINIHKN